MAMARTIIVRSAVLFLIALAAWTVGGQIAPAESSPKTQGHYGKPYKMSPGIQHALEFQQGGLATGGGWALSGNEMDVDSRGLQVYIELETFTQEAVEELESRGLHIEILEPSLRLVQARIPFDRLEAVSQLPFVKFIRLPEYNYHNQQGAIGTQGDPLIRGEIVRQQLGATGAGIRVGVISDGVRGLSQSIASGDLPAQGVSSRSFRADHNLDAGAEGTALLEIIHDVAPGATLFFANMSTSVEFIQAVNWLADEAGGPNARRGTPGGVDVIVEDLSFFNVGAYDGSSSVSQALSNAVVRGAAVFASVGNQAQRHYQGPFSDTDGDTLHEFDVSLGRPRVNNAGETLNVTVRPGESVVILVQWNDPFGASGNDYDLCLFSPADSPASPLFCSDTVQDGHRDPTEGIAITRTAPTSGTIGIGLINPQGRAAPRVFDLFVLGGIMNEFVVPDSSVPNGGDSHFVASVGAVDWRSPNAIESFSSRGPTNDGRLKPELVAPDGVSVTGSGGFPSPFFGTSAAAPHAGALAALILSVNPTLKPGALTAQLAATAIPLGAPLPNNVFGFGRADAFTALGPIPPALGDYDGDGRTDIAARDPQSSTWYIQESGTGQLRTAQFGWSALVPVPGDFDEHDRMDVTMRDPSESSR
jgi:Subtilase family